MYKCKECGAEFELKPEYCDCGNDEFEELVAANNTAESKNIVKEEKKPEEEKSIKPSPPMFETNKSRELKTSPVYHIDPISAIIFCVCLILSAYVIFFAWNPSDNVSEVKETKNTTVSKNIPPIDKFWNNTPPKQENNVPVQKSEEVKPIEIPKQIVKQVIPQSKPVTVQKTVTQPKTRTVPLKKTTQTSKPASNTSVNNKTAQEQAKIAAEAAAKQQAAQEAAKKAAAEAQAKKQAEELAKKMAEQRAKQETAAAKTEYYNYKAGLRNTLGRKIDFTKVIGDGDCVVSFKIDQSGNLINRAFTKQSSNLTLNEAVYKAVMSTPAYNPPPSGYKGETLNLNIKFYNGNFEISLP